MQTEVGGQESNPSPGPVSTLSKQRSGSADLIRSGSADLIRSGSADLIRSWSPRTLKFSVTAEALKELADDLRSGSYSDKERAVSMLSSLTLYVDHHNAILGAGVLPSLLLSIKDERLIPQVSRGLNSRRSGILIA